MPGKPPSIVPKELGKISQMGRGLDPAAASGARKEEEEEERAACY